MYLPMDTPRLQVPEHKRRHLRLRPARQGSGRAAAFDSSTQAGSSGVDEQLQGNAGDADSHHTFASMLAAATARHATACQAKSIGAFPQLHPSSHQIVW